jgi:hypothetical protein
MYCVWVSSYDSEVAVGTTRTETGIVFYVPYAVITNAIAARVGASQETNA